MPLRRCALLSVLVLLLLQPVCDLARGEETEAPSVKWETDLETALEKATFEGRPILLNFHASWCGWCRRLERETFADPKFVKRAKNLVCVRVNGPKRPDLLRKFAVRSYPTTDFLSPNGDVIASVRGYKTAVRFLGILDRALDTSAEEFVLNQRLKDHPDLIELRLDLVRLLLRRGAVPEALEHLDALATTDPNLLGEKRWQFHLDRGHALYIAGRYEEARQELDPYIRHGDLPESVEAVFIYAEALFAEGKRKEARDWYHRLLKERPEGWLAGQSRARLADAG